MFEYALTIIQSFQTILKDDETEYQGLVSKNYALLHNQELYKKTYEQVFMILMRVIRAYNFLLDYPYHLFCHLHSLLPPKKLSQW